MTLEGERYRVVRPVAQGGMAEIFEARVIGGAGFERRVALKQMRSGLASDPEVVDMFVDEARLTSHLHHANIVSVLDYGVADGRPFQILEFVDGDHIGALRERGLAQGSPLPVEVALYVCIEVARALGYAHRATDAEGRRLGLVHRDVSPSNILLSWQGDVKLADFGIAYARERQTETEAGTAKGKLGFMAPEQAMARDVDGRADIFSLGAVLWTLLTGRSPVLGDGLPTLLRGEPLRLDDERVDEPLRAIVVQALAPERADRFFTADRLADALTEVLAARGGGDPRAATQRWLEGLRSAPKKKRALDAMLGFDLILSADSSVRTFATETHRPVEGEPSDRQPGIRAGTPSRTTEPSGEAATAQGPTATTGNAPSEDPVAVAKSSRLRWLALAGIGVATAVLVVVVVSAWPVDEPSRQVVEGSDAPADPSASLGIVQPPTLESEESEAPPSETALADGPRTEVAPPAELPTPTEPTGQEERPTKRVTRPRVGRDPPPNEPPMNATPAGSGDGAFVVAGPGAVRGEVRVDGRRVGFAPLQLRLPTGSHRVEVRTADGETLRRSVVIQPTHTPSAPLRWTIP